MKNNLLTYLPGVVLFTVFFLIGLFTYKDYGIAWDETIQHQTGIVNFEYATSQNKDLLTYHDRDYGPSFELPLIFIERALHLTDATDIYHMRHLVTHIFFLIGAFAFYILCYKLFGDGFIACLGFLILVIAPRIYAHSFINSKDIPFLSVFIICLLLAHIAFEKNKKIGYVLLGMACGFLTGIRIMGLILIAALIFFFFIQLITAYKQKRKLILPIINFVLFISFFLISLYAVWPYLWPAPLPNLSNAINYVSHSRWDGAIIFQGRRYDSFHIPSTYAPVWFCITTPILWLVAGFIGCILAGFSFIKAPLQLTQKSYSKQFFIYLFCFFVPVIAVIILHSVIYDDWRHLYFIYPSFIILILYAVDRARSGGKKILIRLLCLSQIGLTTSSMIRLHPYQQVYFNQLVSHNNEYLRKNYDFEYWGCAFKEGLEYIVQHDSSKQIRVGGISNLIDNNKLMLPPLLRERIITVDRDENPDYVITNFRLHPQDYDYTNIFFEIKRLNSTVVRVYKIH